MPESVKVLLMRRDELEEAERKALSIHFPDREIRLASSASADYVQHAAACEEYQPLLTFLPKDRPVPSLAMQRGFIHVALVDGKLMRLVALVPQWEEYKP